MGRARGRHRLADHPDAYRPHMSRDAVTFLAELRSTSPTPIGAPAAPVPPAVPGHVEGMCLSPDGPRTDPALTRGVESGIDDSTAKIGRIL